MKRGRLQLINKESILGVGVVKQIKNKMTTETKKYSIAIIESEIKKIISENQDLTELIANVDRTLEMVTIAKSTLVSSTAELLNILLKTSKKKVLIKLETKDKEVCCYGTKFEVGINNVGVGVAVVYGYSNSNRLENLTGRYNDSQKLFLRIMEHDGGKYKKIFVDSIDDEEKKKMVSEVLDCCDKVIKKFGNSYDEDEIVADGSLKNFNFKFHRGLIILDSTEEIRSFPKEIEIIEADELKDISKETFSRLEYRDLRQFIHFVNSKTEIMSILKTKLKEIEVIKVELENSQKVVDGYLVPYKALAEI